MNSKMHKLILLAVIIIGSLFWFGVYPDLVGTQAATENQEIIVNVTVPSGSSGSGGGDTVPVISNVASSTSFTTANINWNATDDLGIATVSFVYGLTASYGSSGTVTGNYQTSLSGLATGTLYYFRISVVDTGAHTTEFAGNFSTSPPPVPPPDTTPPVITNVQVFTSMTTATISWNTNELADSQINYGATVAYGSNYFDSAQILNHSVLLLNLDPNTIYHFQIISADSLGNSTSTNDSIFTTQVDSVPPPDASNFSLVTTSNSIILSWVNPSLSGTPDFSHVTVVRKIESASSNPSDGITIYTGNGENFTDTSVMANTNYFYTIFSFDTSNNNSPGIFRSGRIIPPPVPVEICGNSIDDDSNGQADCADSACILSPGCIVTPPSTSTPPSMPPPAEICGNSIDDDSNGQADCADSACFGFGGCTGSGPVAFCNNGFDDDNDGVVDFPADQGCESAVDNDEYNPPEPTVPSFLKINLSDVSFFSGNRLIRLSPIGDTITGLSGSHVTVALPKNVLEGDPKSIILRVGDTDRHQFIFNVTDQVYYADLSFVGLGVAQSYLEIDYDSGQVDSVGFKMNALPWGQVVDSDGNSLAGVEVSLYGNDGAIFPLGLYGQLNPIITDINGSAGWMVPNGDFKISLRKDGYYDRVINYNVTSNVINPTLNLIPLPPKLVLTINPNISISQNIQNIAGALSEQTKSLSTAAVQKIQDAITDPGVQQVNEQVVAPAAITIVVAGVVPLISWIDLLPFLRLLFLQPLMLLGWRKRERWGLVYNSLNKLPVDLAMVRLINMESNRVVQSKVTDSKGRFIFMVGPGKYRLQVQKNSFVFPSQFLKHYSSDGQKADIYHGEIFNITDPSSITATIPVDPVEAHKRPRRLIWEKFGRRLQAALSMVGIVVTAVSVYISPKWYIIVLLIVHVVVFLIFRRLARPSKVRNWGVVYDDTNKAPLSRVITRLFNSQFNKLVDMQMTDGRGKYYFMAGDSKYFVTYEHKEYHPQKTDIINLEGKDAEAITVEVGLKKS